MQAIILAGGFGTRLRSVIADVPKPLAPIGDKPFLAHLLEYLKTQGITRVALSVHYQYEKIQHYFLSSYCGIKIEYAIEDQPLGTGGAIVHSLSFLDSSQPVFVLNGDTFLKLNYGKMASEHLQRHARITMALRHITDTSRYGLVLTQNHRVHAFQERGGPYAGLINAGVYCLQPDVFKAFTVPSIFSFEKDFLFPHVSQLQPLAFIADDYFIDIGVPEDYQRAQADFELFISE